MVEICLQVRTIFRLPLDEDLTAAETGEDADQPVKGTYPLAAFAPPAPTQPLPRELEEPLQVEEQAFDAEPGDVPIEGLQVSSEICCSFIVPHI